jgi:hypothetical protein
MYIVHGRYSPYVIYSDRHYIKSHVVTSHKMNYQDYVTQYGDPEIPTAKWECATAVCSSKTRHERNNIYMLSVRKSL